MAATAEQIAKVRKMVAEPTTTTYSDADITAFIEAHPLDDKAGHPPFVISAGDIVANEEWTATYDLNSAAADIWDEKAAALAANYDFSADGASYSRSQAHTNAKAMAKHYRARRAPKTIRLQPSPKRVETDDDVQSV